MIPVFQTSKPCVIDDTDPENSQAQSESENPLTFLSTISSARCTCGCDVPAAGQTVASCAYDLSGGAWVVGGGLRGLGGGAWRDLPFVAQPPHVLPHSRSCSENRRRGTYLDLLSVHLLRVARRVVVVARAEPGVLLLCSAKRYSLIHTGCETHSLSASQWKLRLRNTLRLVRVAARNARGSGVTTPRSER